MHCVPWAESYKLHEMAARKIYLDSMVYIREGTIIRLENQRDTLLLEFEDLLANSSAMENELLQQVTLFENEAHVLIKKNKRLQRRVAWANIKTVFVGVVGVAVALLIAKD